MPLPMLLPMPLPMVLPMALFKLLPALDKKCNVGYYDKTGGNANV